MSERHWKIQTNEEMVQGALVYCERWWAHRYLVSTIQVSLYTVYSSLSNNMEYSYKGIQELKWANMYFCA